MADAGVGSPPAKSKAKGQAAAAAADASSPAASDTRAGTIRVPGCGTLSVSRDTPGVAIDENGRTVRIATFLSEKILSSPKEAAKLVRDDILGSGTDAEHPVHTEAAA